MAKPIDVNLGTMQGKNILEEGWFQSYGLLKVKEYFRSVLVYMQAVQETDFCDPIFFHHV